jgi:hypothetical protein
MAASTPPLDDQDLVDAAFVVTALSRTSTVADPCA